MLFLWWLCRLGEKIFGPFVLTSIYLLTAIGGGLLSIAWAPTQVSAGASAAILGIAGATVSVVWFGKLKLPSTQLFYLRMIVFILYVLISGLSPGVDNMAHLGGLVAGLLFGFAVARSLRGASLHQRFSTAVLYQGREAPILASARMMPMDTLFWATRCTRLSVMTKQPKSTNLLCPLAARMR